MRRVSVGWWEGKKGKKEGGNAGPARARAEAVVGGWGGDRR